MKPADWLAPAGLSLAATPYAALLLAVPLGGAGAALPFDTKSLEALGGSLALSLAVALASLGLAVACVLLLARLPTPGWRWLILVAAAMSFCLSPVIHLLAWRPLLALWPALPAATLVLAWKYFPLALFMLLLGLDGLDAAGVEAGAAFAPPRRAWRRLILPRMKGVLASAGAVVFALAFAEAEVPPLLGMRVYAEEFMGRIALDSNPGTAALAGLPFLLPALLAAALPARQSAEIAWSRGGLASLAGYFRPWSGFPWAGLVVVLISWPWLALCSRANLGALAAAEGQALANSALLAAAGLGLALVLAYPVVAGLVARTGKWAVFCLVLLICLPGSLLGLGMVALAQWPGMAWLNAGDSALVVAHGLRFAPVATLLLWRLRRLEPAWMRDELRLTGAPRLAVLRFIRVPLDWPKWLALGVLLATLMVSDLACTILVVAPGTETAILRLYNLMHFGAEARVAALAVAQAGLVALVFATSATLLARFARHA